MLEVLLQQMLTVLVEAKQGDHHDGKQDGSSDQPAQQGEQHEADDRSEYQSDGVIVVGALEISAVLHVWILWGLPRAAMAEPLGERPFCRMGAGGIACRTELGPESRRTCVHPRFIQTISIYYICFIA